MPKESIIKSGLPRLRSDLQVSQTDEVSFELVDPQTGKSMLLDSIGFAIAEELEAGDKTVSEIQNSLRNTQGLEIQESEILHFLRMADELGFLESPLKDIGLTPENGSYVFMPKSSHEASKKVKQILDTSRWFDRVDLRLFIPLVSVLVVFILPWKMNIKANFIVRSKNHFIVRAPVQGEVMKVHVSEGQAVSKGDILVSLSGFEDDIRKKRKELERVQAELDRLKEGALKEEIEKVQKELEQEKRLFENARDEVERYKELYVQKLVSEDAFRERVLQRDLQEKRLEKAQAEFNLVASGTREELLRAKEAERDSILIDLELFQELQFKSVLHAPSNGVVSSKDLFELTGRYIRAGDEVLKITDPHELVLEMSVPETDIGVVLIGAPVRLKVQAFASQTFHAKVRRISPVAEKDEKNYSTEAFFRVFSDLENTDGRIRPGMTGVAQIGGPWRTLGLLWFRHAIRFIRVHYVL